MSRAPSRVKQGRQILELTLHRIRSRVPAVAASAARVVVHRELARQRRHEHRVLGTIIESAANQYNSWSGTLALIGNLRSIGGRHRLHTTAHVQSDY